MDDATVDNSRFSLPLGVLFSGTYASRPQFVDLVFSFFGALTNFPIEEGLKPQLWEQFSVADALDEDRCERFRVSLERATEARENPVLASAFNRLLAKSIEVSSAMSANDTVGIIHQSIETIASFSHVLELHADKYHVNFNEISGTELEGDHPAFALQTTWYYLEKSLFDLTYCPGELAVMEKLLDVYADMICAGMSFDQEAMANYLVEKLDYTSVALPLVGQRHFTMLSLSKGPVSPSFKMLFYRAYLGASGVPELDDLVVLSWLNTGAGRLRSRSSESGVANLGVLPKNLGSTVRDILTANSESDQFGMDKGLYDTYADLTQKIKTCHLMCNRGKKLSYKAQELGTCTQNAQKFFLMYFLSNLAQFGLPSSVVDPKASHDKIIAYIGNQAEKESKRG